MKKLFHIITPIIFLTACVNNSVEDLEKELVDCTQSGLTVVDISSVKSDCDSPGSISLTVSGGEPPYMYSIDGENFQLSESFGGLFAGDFFIVVQDNLGCSVETEFSLEAEDSGISLTLSSEDTSCAASTGSISANASGGSGTLEFALDNGSFGESGVFSDLSAGEYTVSVRDGDNCVVEKTIIVETNTSLSADIMPIISSNCAISGCHSGSVSPNLTSSSSVISNASRIKSETQSGSMPRGRTLTSTQIDLIACWVDDGAKNN